MVSQESGGNNQFFLPKMELVGGVDFPLLV
jgi:hypothetical protein